MKDTLGDRMKSYENCYRFQLPPHFPIIIRLDGRAFHTYSSDFVKPYDSTLHFGMVEATRALCCEVEGCKFGFTQSDEISLVVVSGENPNTTPWFDNVIAKITSIAAATTSVAFHEAMREAVVENNEYKSDAEFKKAYKTYLGDKIKRVVFDARAFVVPIHEVTNYFIWRQQDAINNSIQALAQTQFSQKELNNKKNAEILKMLAAKDIFWENYEPWQKYGSGVVKNRVAAQVIVYKNETLKIWHNNWDECKDLPIFSENKAWLEEKIWRKNNE